MLVGGRFYPPQAPGQPRRGRGGGDGSMTDRGQLRSQFAPAQPFANEYESVDGYGGRLQAAPKARAAPLRAPPWGEAKGHGTGRAPLRSEYNEAKQKPWGDFKPGHPQQHAHGAGNDVRNWEQKGRHVPKATAAVRDDLLGAATTRPEDQHEVIHRHNAAEPRTYDTNVNHVQDPDSARGRGAGWRLRGREGYDKLGMHSEYYRGRPGPGEDSAGQKVPEWHQNEISWEAHAGKGMMRGREDHSHHSNQNPTALRLQMQQKMGVRHKHLKDAFLAVDTDRNGTISHEEIQVLCRNHGLPQQAAAALMDVADKQGNGELDFNMFVQVMQLKEDESGDWRPSSWRKDDAPPRGRAGGSAAPDEAKAGEPAVWQQRNVDTVPSMRPGVVKRSVQKITSARGAHNHDPLKHSAMSDPLRRLQLQLQQQLGVRFKRLQDAFLAFDKDRNGSIDIEEIREMCAAYQLPADQAAALMGLADENEDGELQYHEFAQALNTKDYDDQDEHFEQLAGGIRKRAQGHKGLVEMLKPMGCMVPPAPRPELMAHPPRGVRELDDAQYNGDPALNGIPEPEQDQQFIRGVQKLEARDLVGNGPKLQQFNDPFYYPGKAMRAGSGPAGQPRHGRRTQPQQFVKTAARNEIFRSAFQTMDKVQCGRLDTRQVMQLQTKIGIPGMQMDTLLEMMNRNLDGKCSLSNFCTAMEGWMPSSGIPSIPLKNPMSVPTDRHLKRFMVVPVDPLGDNSSNPRFGRRSIMSERFRYDSGQVKGRSMLDHMEGNGKALGGAAERGGGDIGSHYNPARAHPSSNTFVNRATRN